MLLSFRAPPHHPPKKDESFDKEVKRFREGGDGVAVWEEVTAATREVAIGELEGGGEINQEAHGGGFGDGGVEVVGGGNSSRRAGRRGDEGEEKEPNCNPKPKHGTLGGKGGGGSMEPQKPKQSLWKDIMISKDGQLTSRKTRRMADIERKVRLSWEY